MVQNYGNKPRLKLCKTLHISEIKSAWWLFLIVSKKSPITPPDPLFFAPFCTFGRKQKSPKVIDLQGFSLFCFSYQWCHQESNRGHKDFQSFALPTELWHLAWLLSAYLSVFYGLFYPLKMKYFFFWFNCWFKQVVWVNNYFNEKDSKWMIFKCCLCFIN